ncbi:hypothetical protein [Frondihabitans cladoniiphilus]|uniref:Glycosyltransferase RgtA/B/C/D-like domain-containing protein n=1 Tax=Frondihabitans cladoniiphilus TaxID=715785 RepID=A0ABP8VPP4_9MICO
MHIWGRRAVRAAPVLALILTVALAIVVRLQFASTGSASLDADEATTGMMVRTILSGQNGYVFFAGQTYNGSAEQYLQAAAIWLFHLPQTPFALRLVQVALSAGTVVAVYRLARLVTRGLWIPVVAALVFAVGPFWNVFFSTKSYGSYDSTQLVAVLGVICALRATGFLVDAQREQSTTRVRWGWWFGLGLACGLVVWLGLSGLEVLIAAILWVLPWFFRSIRAVVATVVGALIGSLPVTWWIVRHSWTLPSAGGPQPVTTIHQRFDILTSVVGRQFLGLVGSSESTPWPAVIQNSILVIGVVVVVIAVVLRVRGLAAVVTGRRSHRRAVDLVLLVFPVAIVIYLLSSHTWYSGSPRYLFILYPFVAVSAAAVIGWIGSKRTVLSRRLPDFRPIVAVITASALVLTLGSTAIGTAQQAEPEGHTTDAEFVSALHGIDKAGIHDLYADYWTAVPAQYFGANTDVTVAEWAPMARFIGVRKQVDAAKAFSYMTSNRVLTSESQQMPAALDAHHVTYRTLHFGTITVFTDLKPAIRPDELGLVN